MRRIDPLVGGRFHLKHIYMIGFVVLVVIGLTACGEKYVPEENVPALANRKDVGFGSIALRVPRGRIMLARKDHQYCAITFLRLWTGQTDEDWFAEYTSYFQEDISGDLTATNVKVRTEELSSPKPRGVGHVAFSFGKRDVTCGPITLGWTNGGWISFYGSKLEEGDHGIELAPTPWWDISEVNVFDPRVKWYRYDPDRERITVPIDTLWEDTEQETSK